jgi:DNA primase
VNVANGGFYCFSCGAKGGDVLEFVRLHYGLSFPDALKHFQIETDYQSKPKRKELPISLDQMLARKLALAVEYGMEMPEDASE